MDGAPAYVDALRRAQAAERRTLSELRAEGTIGDDAFHRLEEELDWAEINAEAILGRPEG
jgi:CPA1 family monovalent cation:H+ antiporter